MITLKIAGERELPVEPAVVWDRLVVVLSASGSSLRPGDEFQPPDQARSNGTQPPPANGLRLAEIRPYQSLRLEADDDDVRMSLDLRLQASGRVTMVAVSGAGRFPGGRVLRTATVLFRRRIARISQSVADLILFEIEALATGVVPADRPDPRQHVPFARRMPGNGTGDGEAHPPLLLSNYNDATAAADDRQA